MKKKQLLVGLLCLCVINTIPTYANQTENELLTEQLDEQYYVAEDGSIVANMLSEHEMQIIESMESENDKEEREKQEEAIPLQAVNYAVEKIDYPYSKERRHSGNAYDCSSLMYYAYLDSGIDLSYDGMTTAAAMSRGLVNSGCEVSAEDIQPGDLIFYSTEKNGRYKNISHVAMYIGDGQQIEASSSKKKVKTRDLSFKNVVNVCRPVLA